MEKIIVIQCAGSKTPERKYWRWGDEQIIFVADREKYRQECPESSLVPFRPDDLDPDTSKTWRQELEDYNEEYKRTGANPFRLCKAWELYKHKIYKDLVKDHPHRYHEKNVFILSAGWGLIRSDFLLPHYNITFSPSKTPKYARRDKQDFVNFKDDNQLSGVTNERSTIYFFGGLDYLPLFCKLTRNVPGTKVIYYKCSEGALKKATGECTTENHKPKPYEPEDDKKQRQTTNWQYACVDEFMEGKLDP